MAFTIKVDKEGVRVVAERLDNLADAAEDLRDPFDRFGDWVAERNTEAFRTEGRSHTPGGWEPLSPATLRQKSGWQILVDTGAMRDSLTIRPFPIERINPHDFEFGTDDDKYRYHHEGTRWMPARPVMVFDDEATEVLVDLITEHFNDAIEEAGPPHRSGRL